MQEASTLALCEALLDFAAAPGRHALRLREPVLLFDELDLVALWALGRLPEGLSEPQAVRQAALLFVLRACFAPGLNHYQLLGLSRSFQTAQLRARYRALIRLTHPDMGIEGLPVGAAGMVNRAHAVLADEAQRAVYDRQLLTQLPSAAAVSPGAGQHTGRFGAAAASPSGLALMGSRWSGLRHLASMRVVRMLLTGGVLLLGAVLALGWAMRGTGNQGRLVANERSESALKPATAETDTVRLRIPAQWSNGIDVPAASVQLPSALVNGGPAATTASAAQAAPAAQALASGPGAMPFAAGVRPNAPVNLPVSAPFNAPVSAAFNAPVSASVNVAASASVAPPAPVVTPKLAEPASPATSTAPSTAPSAASAPSPSPSFFASLASAFKASPAKPEEVAVASASAAVKPASASTPGSAPTAALKTASSAASSAASAPTLASPLTSASTPPAKAAPTAAQASATATATATATASAAAPGPRWPSAKADTAPAVAPSADVPVVAGRSTVWDVDVPSARTYLQDLLTQLAQPEQARSTSHALAQMNVNGSLLMPPGAVGDVVRSVQIERADLSESHRPGVLRIRGVMRAQVSSPNTQSRAVRWRVQAEFRGTAQGTVLTLLDLKDTE
jgi:hypothetical protein